MCINKKVLTIAALAVGTATCVGFAIARKKRKNNEETNINDTNDIINNEEEIIDEDIAEDFEEVVDEDTVEKEIINEEEFEEVVDEEADDGIVETSNEVVDNGEIEDAEETVEVEEKIQPNVVKDKNALLRYNLINHLAKNGVDQETILCLGKLDLDVLEEIPDQHDQVEELINNFINDEFKAEKVNDLFNKIYDLLYTTMSPFSVFDKYSDKTDKLGEECQATLLDFIEVLDGKIADRDPEAINTFAELYNVLTLTPVENFNEKLYEEKFKPLFNKFVKVKKTKSTKNTKMTNENVVSFKEV